MKSNTRALVAAAAALAVSGSLVATSASANGPSGTYAVRVTVENLAPDDGTLQTPVWLGLHDGSFDLYDRGAASSPELERLAEDGNTGPLSALFADTSDGVDATTTGGPLAPGASASHLFTIDAADGDNYFSYASMVIPSNDAFVANGDPLAHPIFDADGNVIIDDIIVGGADVLDAGTEVNDEVPENTAALAQAVPDTGVDEGGVVELHPGFDAAGNIVAARPGADFTRDGYEALRISFEVTPLDLTVRTIYSVLDGFQEVPAIDVPSVGYATFKIAGRSTRIEVQSQFWNTDNVVAAHLHLGARGENGPVIVNLGALAGNDDLSDGVDGVTFRKGALTGPLEGAELAALVAEIEAGNVYINVHTPDNPAGQLRGQLVPTP